MKPTFVKLSPAQELRNKLRDELKKRYPVEEIDEDLYENMISVEDFNGRYIAMVVDENTLGRFALCSRMASVAENSRLVIDFSPECSAEVRAVAGRYCDGHIVSVVE